MRNTIHAAIKNKKSLKATTHRTNFILLYRSSTLQKIIMHTQKCPVRALFYRQRSNTSIISIQCEHCSNNSNTKSSEVIMMNKHGELFIYINFADASGNTRLWQFKSHIVVIVAESIKDVIPCLNKVQTATERGFFVAGFLSYEAAAAFHKDITVHQTQQIPLLWFGVFEQPTAEPLTNTQPFTISDWLPHVSKEAYGQNVDRILKAIQKGETEQVNYTIPFHACFSGDARTYYNQLKEAQSAHYSAYINIGHTSILSASPELFFHLDKNIITTRPMKGTVARGKTYAEDTYLSHRLQTSRKNRHENKLIVELMKQERSEEHTS